METKLNRTQLRVLDMLAQPAGATVDSVKKECHTTECRKVVSDLRRKGFNIVDAWEHYTDEDSVEHRYKRYKLKEAEDYVQ